MRKMISLFLALVLITLAGCATFRGMGQDAESLGRKTETHEVTSRPSDHRVMIAAASMAPIHAARRSRHDRGTTPSLKDWMSRTNGIVPGITTPTNTKVTTHPQFPARP